MRRKKILAVATILTVSAIILPLLAAVHFARQRALDDEQAELSQFAHWTLFRAVVTVAEAAKSLKQLKGERWDGCSPAHIARMRQLSTDNTYVEEFGYYRDGRLACTSWGAVGKIVPRSVPEQRLPGGIGVDLGTKPAISQAGTVMVLSFGDHNALIKPERLVNVLREGRMALGIAMRDGTPVAVSGYVDPTLLRALAQGAVSGNRDQLMFASEAGSGLVAFAVADQTLIQARLQRERWSLVPLGLLLSILLIGIIIWETRRLLAPRKVLEVAIRQRDLVPHYQPVIELATGLCVGAEALIRWRQPHVTNMTPDQLIPLAEQTGLIVPLTDLMIDCVAADVAQILSAGLDIHIAINICASDMETGRFLSVLSVALARNGVPTAQIWLEATERGFLHPESVGKTIGQAHATGYMVSIDDFGTGYSSLSLLEALPIDTLKIDKSFIDTIGTRSATGVVTPHIIEMAHDLKLSIIAEGVELPAQADYLRAAGVQFVQGWLYSKALPVEEFIDYCQSLNDKQHAVRPQTGRRARRTVKPQSTSA